MAKHSPKPGGLSISMKAAQPTTRKSSGGGGPTASGGFNFQAAVTAIVMSSALRGVALRWLEGLAQDIPVRVAAETGSGGDDLRLVFNDGSIAEVQVKKGLTQGASLWDALLDLAKPLAEGAAQYGVLVVSPNSSGPVRVDLATDVVAIGEGRPIEEGRPGAVLIAKLKASGRDPQAVCRKLRVVTIAAAEASDGDVRAALANLGSVCAREQDAPAAWDRLYRDAHTMQSSRGVRDRATLAQVLRSAGIALRDDPNLPSGFLEQLCRWTMATNAEFTILGVDRPLSLETAYIALNPFVETQEDSGDALPDLASAVARYHNWNLRISRRDTQTSDPLALGRHYRRAVVVAGPGAGKSTLLAKIARAYAVDGLPVLKADGRAIARRISAGEGFEEALFQVALDGAPVAAHQARALAGVDWVVLLDGLDESGHGRPAVVRGLKAFAEGRPSVRLIVATRPVGYQWAEFAGWRHYAVPGIPEDDVVRTLSQLLTHILPASDPRRVNLQKRVKSAVAASGSGKTALRTPLMLGLAAALFASGDTLGKSRTAFYRAVFDLVSRTPSERLPANPPAAPILKRFLDAAGWKLVSDPDATADAVTGFAAGILKDDLSLTQLAAGALAVECCEYWQALGIVEELWQGSDRALAFVHKTFGEFAAGRFLAEADPAVQRSALEASAADPGLRECVAFAAAEGLAPLVLDELQTLGFAGSPGEARLLQGLDILIDAVPPVSFELAQPVIAAAVEAAFDDRQDPVGRIGLKLRGLGPRYPEPLAGAARRLMIHGQNWTRLAGLALAHVAEPEQMSLLAWIDRLAEVAGSSPDGSGVRGFRQSDAGVKLLQAFAHDLARRVVAEMSDDEASEIFARAFGGADLNRMGFIIDMETLIQGTAIRPWWDLGPIGSFPRFDGDEIRRMMRATFTAFVRGLQPPRTTNDALQPPTDRHLQALSAFMSVVDFDGTSLPDLWPLEDFGESDDVRWLWDTVARWAGISIDALWSDAADMEATLAIFEGEGLTAMHRRIFAVDVPSLNGRPAEPVDEPLLERALRRPSTLVVEPAYRVASTAGVAVVRRLATRLLVDGEDASLWAGAALTGKLPRPEASDLLFTHASGRLRSGSSHVIARLSKQDVDEDPRRQAVMKAALLQMQEPEAAVAAARWFAARPVVADMKIAADAFAYWRRNETPQPASGAVPTSPREDLLTGLLALAPETLDGLLDHWKDSRSGVRSVAHSAFTARLTEAAALDEIVGAAVSGRLPSPWLKDLAAHGDRLSPSHAQALCVCLESPDASARFAMLDLLQVRVLPRDLRRAALVVLRRDSSNPVRERAEELLHALERENDPEP